MAAKTNDKGFDVELVAGIDVGNGYVKAAVEAVGLSKMALDVQSACAYTSSERVPQEPREDTVRELPGHLDATVMGPGIDARHERRMFFGDRAVMSDRPTICFDIASGAPKSAEPLSYLLICDVLACCGIRAVFERDGVVPPRIKVRASIGVALPIGDYFDHRDQFKMTLESRPYLVTVNNFEQPVTVEVDVAHAFVGAEGAVGNFELFRQGVPFMEDALAIARADGQDIPEEIDGRMLSEVEGFISIDVGDGTTNIPVFVPTAEGSDLSEELSSSIPSGYGTVLQRVVDRNINTPRRVKDRKALSDLLLAERLWPAQREMRDRLMVDVAEESEIFARDVQQAFSRVWDASKLFASVVFVYGGGAQPLKDVLVPAIQEASDLGDGQCVPVIVLGDEARSLNRNGLYQMVKAQLQAIGA